MGLLLGYFGLVGLFFAGLSMAKGAGTSVDGFVEVLVMVVLSGLCFSLAWVLIASARTRSRSDP